MESEGGRGEAGRGTGAGGARGVRAAGGHEVLVTYLGDEEGERKEDEETRYIRGSRCVSGVTLEEDEDALVQWQ